MGATPAIGFIFGRSGPLCDDLQPRPSLCIASDVLPIAAEIDGNKVGVLYFEAGRVAGYQPVALTGSLLGTPRLASDQDRFLYLIWSDPQETGAAHFNVSATKTLLED